MSGSKQLFIYSSDPDQDGGTLDKVLKLDESNMRAIGYAPITASELSALVDRRVRPLDGTERYINLIGTTRGGKIVSRRIIVLDVSNTLFQDGGTVSLPVLTGNDNLTVETVVFRVQSARGEERSFASVGDTGLDDTSTDLST